MIINIIAKNSYSDLKKNKKSYAFYSNRGVL